MRFNRWNNNRGTSALHLTLLFNHLKKPLKLSDLLNEVKGYTSYLNALPEQKNEDDEV